MTAVPVDPPLERARAAIAAYRAASTEATRREMGLALLAIRDRWPYGRGARGIWSAWLAAEGLAHPTAIAIMRRVRAPALPAPAPVRTRTPRTIGPEVLFDRLGEVSTWRAWTPRAARPGETCPPPGQHCELVLCRWHLARVEGVDRPGRRHPDRRLPAPTFVPLWLDPSAETCLHRAIDRAEREDWTREQKAEALGISVESYSWSLRTARAKLAAVRADAGEHSPVALALDLIGEAPGRHRAGG